MKGKKKEGGRRYESCRAAPGGGALMSPVDWLLLAALAVLLALALRFRSRGCSGCTGDCASCRRRSKRK